MMNSQGNILIIGMSRMGKTHFGGQLYGRLKTNTFHYKLGSTPGDLGLFENILQNLNQGLEGRHTDTKLHETIILPVLSPSGRNLDLVYPEYGGEQLRVLLEHREINKKWAKGIRDSEHWFLFVRLDMVEDVADVTTRFYKQIKEETEVADRIVNITDLPENSSAFYIELLQMFLSVKGASLSASKKPTLTILLSCWDKLNFSLGHLPRKALEEKMPMFFNFVQSNWRTENLHIMGLSSLGKDLSGTTPDPDYALEGPEKFGYLILENGQQEIDITQVLNSTEA
ncbi:MAG: hypothetical protein WCF67_13180 [Chitinophagaceae bacterium]